MLSVRTWSMIGALLAGLAVVAGAWAAHGLPKHLAGQYTEAPPYEFAGHEMPLVWKRVQDFATAAEYQMYHALGLIAVGLFARDGKRKSLAIAGWSFLLGILLFSGSLYALSLTGNTKLGMITPIGGVAFIVGWGALAAAVCPCGNGGGRSAEG